MVAWITPFPSPLQEGYQRTAQGSVISFGTEVGAGKHRRRSTIRVKPHIINFHISAAELISFETYFENTLKDGALPFTWNDPVTATAATWRFDDQNPYSVVVVSGLIYALSIRVRRMS